MHSDLRGDPSAEQRAASLFSLGDLPSWQSIQHLLGQVVGVNLSLLDSSGNQTLPPCRISGFCSEFVHYLPAVPAEPPNDCPAQAVAYYLTQNEPFYQCPHGLNFTVVKIAEDAFWVIGPILVGVRQSQEIYTQNCLNNGIDPELFCDRVREIKVFSHQGIRNLLNFCARLSSFLISH